MKSICLATRNPGKVAELQALLAPAWSVTDLSQYPQAPLVEETGTTIHENALLKAQQVSLKVPGLVLADDSGLEVEALHGAPGVHSARYAGPGADAAANNQKLLAELERLGARTPAQRRARFRCTLAMAQVGNVLKTFEGECRGVIAAAPQGSGGFGYDPLFVPEGHDQTFAQMAPELKNQISHRAQALQKFLEWMRQESLG